MDGCGCRRRRRRSRAASPLILTLPRSQPASLLLRLLATIILHRIIILILILILIPILIPILPLCPCSAARSMQPMPLRHVTVATASAWLHACTGGA